MLILPEAWADWMTLLLLAIAAFLLLRRLISAEIRKASSLLDIVLILVAALPFMTGYFLKHGTLSSIPFLYDHMATIHMALKKIALTLPHDYIHSCPSCRKTGMGDLYRRLSPSLKSPQKTQER
jgi:hypothetical protein